MPRLLLCPPEHYRIAYEINPWMHRSQPSDAARSWQQWRGLERALVEAGGDLEYLDAAPAVPDLVFTANAGLVVDRQVFLSRFRHVERQPETAYFENWFRAHGYTVRLLPAGSRFEGEGDALFCGKTLFCGYRFRSDIRAHQWLGEQLGCLTITLELVDPRFYHLDTCFCPLGDDAAMWYPAAFDRYAQRTLQAHLRDLIEVSAEEAIHFACNAVMIDSHVMLPAGCPQLTAALRDRGYHCHPLAMTEFIKSGGACKCLVLCLSHSLLRIESSESQKTNEAVAA